jgi:GT2 family glycosyltransferase
VKIGVAIPAHNVKPYVETCLTSIREQITHAFRPAIYVADDCSDDGTWEFLADRPRWYRGITRNHDRLGWPATLNAAVSLALQDGCDAVFTMNADDFLRLDCLRELEHQMFLMDLDIVVPWTQQVGGDNVVQESQAFPCLVDFVDHTPLTAFSLVTRETWMELGGYATDVNLPGLLAGYNELDFYVRAVKAGKAIGTVEKPLVYYRMRPGQLHLLTTAQHYRAMDLIYTKHPELLALKEAGEL